MAEEVIVLIVGAVAPSPLRRGRLLLIAPVASFG